MLVINIDGSCDCSSGEGSWSYILNGKSFSGREEDHTTNNRMELMAAIKALESVLDPCNILVLSDSRYVVNGIMLYVKKWSENGWINSQNKPVKNKDLWENLIEKKKKHNQVIFKWIRREENSAADYAAKKARGVK